ncbi:MAG: hypothetical protein Kow00124_07360 [Anaerolineae bacterium]
MTLTVSQADLIGGVLGFVFTLALLSYLIGDNPLYRIALHLFIGVAVGYAALVVIYQVLQPRLIEPLRSPDLRTIGLSVVPLVLFLFMIMKLSHRTAPLGNISTGYLIGVGAATAMGGALVGTLLPQIQATWLPLLPGSSPAFLNSIVIVVGTVTTLLYFQFWVRESKRHGQPRRTGIMRLVAGVGKGFVVLTLATIYGGMILSGIAIFSERLMALSEWVLSIIP